MKKEANNSIQKTELLFDHSEGDLVFLKNENQTFSLPNNLLPKEAKEGDKFILTLSTDKYELKKREKTAKEILNEILN